VLGAGDDRAQLRHHLAAVADAQREGVLAAEERGEHLAQRVPLQDRGRPAAAGTEHVAIAEAAAGDQGIEVLQVEATSDEVAHVHVERIETGAVERHRGFDLAVDALLAQDRDLRPRALCDVRCSDVLGGIEGEFRLQPRGIEAARGLALAVGTVRVVAQLLHRVGDRPPGIEQLFPAPFGEHLVLVVDADDRGGSGPGDALRAFDQAVLRDQVGERGAFLDRHLHDRAEFLVEQGAEHVGMAAIAPAVEADVEAQARGEGHLA